MIQIQDHDSKEPLETSSLMAHQNNGAPRYLLFLKDKNIGRIKGQAYTNGRSQQGKIYKYYTASSMVSLLSIILSGVLDAY